MPAKSRRAFLAGSAALAASGTIPALAADTDPILAAIEAHRAAWDALGEAENALDEAETAALRNPAFQGFNPTRLLPRARLCFIRIGEERSPVYANSREEIDAYFDRCDDHFRRMTLREPRSQGERSRCYAELERDAEALARAHDLLGLTPLHKRLDAAAANERKAMNALVTTPASSIAGAAALAAYLHALMFDTGALDTASLPDRAFTALSANLAALVA